MLITFFFSSDVMKTYHVQISYLHNWISQNFTFLFIYQKCVPFHVPWWVICSLLLCFQASSVQHAAPKYDFPVKHILLTRDPKDRSVRGTSCTVMMKFSVYLHRFLFFFIHCVNSKSSTAEVMHAFKKCLHNMKTVLV